MRSTNRSRRPAIAGLIAAGLLASLAGPALAKDLLRAWFDAPIAFGTPERIEIIVGLTITALDDDAHPVSGSPIFLRLTGRDGSSTTALGTETSPPGHYSFRIEVPAGGPRDVEVGLTGATDLQVRIMNAPFAFGPVGRGTAQLAPPTTGPVTGAADPAPATDPTAAPAVPPVVVGSLAFVVAALAAAGLAIALRRTRRPRRMATPPRGPGT
jgi:hypothetical protein